MKLHNEEIRASCAAELRSVLDSYISPDMGAGAATAVLRAMEEASAHVLVQYGMLGAQPAGDVAEMIGAYVFGITRRVQVMQGSAKGHQR